MLVYATYGFKKCSLIPANIINYLIQQNTLTVHMV